MIAPRFGAAAIFGREAMPGIQLAKRAVEERSVRGCPAEHDHATENFTHNPSARAGHGGAAAVVTMAS
jgi:hypothetical protein